MTQLVTREQLLGTRIVGVAADAANAYGAFFYEIAARKSTGALFWNKVPGQAKPIAIPMPNGTIGPDRKRTIEIRHTHSNRKKADAHAALWCDENGYQFHPSIVHGVPVRVKHLLDMNLPMTEEMLTEAVRIKLTGK